MPPQNHSHAAVVLILCIVSLSFVNRDGRPQEPLSWMNWVNQRRRQFVAVEHLKPILERPVLLSFIYKDLRFFPQRLLVELPGCIAEEAENLEKPPDRVQPL